MPTAEDRRRTQRFPLDLPLEVKLREPAGETQKPAVLQDISANGVFFMVDRQLQPDSKLEFYVRLQIEGAPEAVLLHCVGSVVRVVPNPTEPGKVGIGARIERYRFLRPGEAPPEGTPEVALS
ncbi:MAG: PilZ domain-containing protein [Candidatus Acidiferrales bacterium]